jgi:hypothetical protein
MMKVYSVSPNRKAYLKTGEPYGKNRKAMKRWLRDVRAGRWWDNDDLLDDDFDERDAWLSVCGEFITNGLHCPKCRQEPPCGCPCSFCQDGEDEDAGDAFYFDNDFDDDGFDDEEDFDLDECGRGNDYEGCTLAGTEFCDFECPNSR